MDIAKLHKLHGPTMNGLLFFSNDASEERRITYEELFLETWDRIPEDNRVTILKNLEFILCKKVDDPFDPHQNTPACILYSRISRRCFVIYNPVIGFLKHETRVHILAHELAHAFYNHPFVGFKLGCEKEKKYTEEEAEPQAYSLTEEWKFIPHSDDISKLRSYRNFVRKEE